jgi:hypothetical protein
VDVDVLDPHLSDHYAIFLDMQYIEKIKVDSVTWTRQMTTNNIKNFCENLDRVDWEFVNSLYTAKEKFEWFFENFLKIFYQCFPKKRLKINNNTENQLWFGKELERKRNVLEVLDVVRKCTGSPQTKNLYNKLRIAYKASINQAKKNYYSNLIEKSNNKSSTIWKIVKGLNAVNYHETVPHLTADSFQQFFGESVKHIAERFSDENDNSPMTYLKKFITSNKNSFFLRPTTPQEVHSLILQLANSNTKDIYDISSKVLKISIDFISYPLHIIINSCFEEGYFPEQLKKSKIVPIFKKGNKEEVQNYRPIAIVPALSKIFELAIKIRLTDYFDKQGFFSERQYGYRKSRSTITALLEVVNRIIQTYEDGSILSATFLDLSKAFDCINHEILLEKLQHYGVRSQTLQLISNYLHDRSQEVFYNSQTSGSVMLNIGVPQGSILGPLLFIIYANDFESNITTATPYLYADDTTLVSVNSNPAAVETQSQQSYSEAKQWFLMNKMTLNEKKTAQLHFTLKSFTCNDATNHEKFLGVVIDSKLTWNEHISEVANKLSRQIYLFRSLNQIVSNETLKCVYYAHFQSIMNYGIILWGHSSGCHRLFRLQKKVIRLLARAKKRDSCKPLFIQLKILSLSSLYVYRCLEYVVQKRSSVDRAQDVHQHDTV